MNILIKLGAVASISVLAACTGTNDVDLETDSTVGSADAGSTSSIQPGSQAALEQIGNRVFFGFDRFDLTPKAQDVLRQQAAFLKEFPGTSIRIEGHCDERGTREYNLALGARRANAARDFLIGLGVDGSRISTISYGKERPLDPRSTEEAWALNRRATTTLVSSIS